MSKKRKRISLQGTSIPATESATTSNVTNNTILPDENVPNGNIENSESPQQVDTVLVYGNTPVEITDEVSEEVSNSVEGESTTLPENTTVIDEKAEQKTLNKAKKSGSKTATDKRVKLADSSYHYYRHFLKGLLRSNEVGSAKFKKNEEGWHGQISVLTSEKDFADKVLTQYKSDNPEIKELWW